MKLFRKFTLFAALLLPIISFAQPNFSEKVLIDCGPIENQQKTGTCWSFSTASFLESELMRLGMDYINLSEMYIVRNIYLEKGLNYVLRQGSAPFGQGSLAHDYLNAAEKYGVVPESEFSGRKRKNASYDHSSLSKELEKVTVKAVKEKHAPSQWMPAYTELLNKEIGSELDAFMYKGNIYSPLEFYRALPIRKDDYIHLTSFTHHPFYSNFILEIPDNFSNGTYLNIPLEELVEVTRKALEKGYTVIWDGDVSEGGFKAREGIAQLEEDLTPSQLNRQNAFMSFQTTDDHLMHIVGIAEDDTGNEFFIVKNSWGEIGPFNGYLYMSVPYFKMKTVAITLHKDVVDENLKIPGM